MVTAFIFFIHFIFLLIVFTKFWQNEGLSTAFTNLALVSILFTVGWSIAGTATKFLIDAEGFGIYYDRDALSLTILTFGELFFYRVYYHDLFTSDGKEIQ